MYTSNCHSEERFVADKWDLSRLKSVDEVSRRFGFQLWFTDNKERAEINVGERYNLC